VGAGGLSRKTGQGWPWVALFVIVQEASLGACKIVSFHIRAQGMRNALAGASLIAPPALGGGLLLIGPQSQNFIDLSRRYSTSFGRPMCHCDPTLCKEDGQCSLFSESVQYRTGLV